MEKSRRSSRFAEAAFGSLSAVELPLATPYGFLPIEVAMDVVSADIPALFGLEVLDGEFFSQKQSPTDSIRGLSRLRRENL